MTREVKIGFFTILIILSAWMGVKFLSGIDLLSNNREYYAIYDQAGGIQKSAPIFIKGVKIGNVSDIELDFSTAATPKVKLTLIISNEYEIPRDSEAKMYSTGVMGSMAIEILMGSSTDYLPNGSKINSTREAGLLDSAGEEITNITGQIEGLTTDLAKTLESINSILDKNASQIDGIMRNMNALMANTNKVVTQNQDEIALLLDGFAKVSETMGNNAPQIDSLIKSISGLAVQMEQEQVVPELKSTLAELNVLMAQVNSHEGTLGKIVGDDALYGNIIEITTSLNNLLIDFKDHPGRYVHLSLFNRSKEKEKE
ncbi:MAG: MlaD family protein [Rikenellaceae bacterium]